MKKTHTPFTLSSCYILIWGNYEKREKLHIFSDFIGRLSKVKDYDSLSSTVI